ncbi:hypothetical protein D3C72_657890 [compost metagenome]
MAAMSAWDRDSRSRASQITTSNAPPLAARSMVRNPGRLAIEAPDMPASSKAPTISMPWLAAKARHATNWSSIEFCFCRSLEKRA